MNKLDFYLFHLMPYPYIPPGEEIESTWVTLPTRTTTRRSAHRLYNEYLEQLIAGEKLGYDGLCVNEHHQNAYGTMPVAEHHGARTSSPRPSGSRSAIIGNALPLHDNPVRVAEEIAMLDVISGGPHHLRLRARHRHGVLLLRAPTRATRRSASGRRTTSSSRRGPSRARSRWQGKHFRPAVREPVAAAAAAAAPAGLAAGLRLDGDDQEGGRAPLPVHDGLRAAVVHEAELRHVPARGRGGRLRSLAQATRAPRSRPTWPRRRSRPTARRSRT